MPSTSLSTGQSSDGLGPGTLALRLKDGEPTTGRTDKTVGNFSLCAETGGMVGSLMSSGMAGAESAGGVERTAVPGGC